MVRYTTIIGLTSVLALVGCDEIRSAKVMVDQELRTKLFNECLSSVPAGPLVTKYNDWDEVVDSCSSSAYNRSLYCVADCDAKYNSIPMREELKK